MRWATTHERTTLRGLSGVLVLVEDIDPGAERDGLMKHQIQADVELRLRQAGIAVLTWKQVRVVPGAPYLYVNVHARKSLSPATFYVYRIDVDLVQDTYLKRDPSIRSSDTTWHIGALGATAVHDLHMVRGQVADLVDRFINAYYDVNPHTDGLHMIHPGQRDMLSLSLA
jgi:hypothetical protein